MSSAPSNEISPARSAAAAVLIGLALLVPAAVPGSAEYPWYSVVPPVLAIGLAFLTRRVMFSLGAAVLIGAALAHLPRHSAEPAAYAKAAIDVGKLFKSAVIDSRDHQNILGFIFFIITAISVMVVSGGFQAIVSRLARLARTARLTQLVTALTGLIVFIDDYANTVIVGNSMRPLCDDRRVSRAKLAFLVDATSAPVAGVALLGTWAAYQVGLFTDLGNNPKTAVYELPDGYSMLVDMAALRFYCLLMLFFVFVNAISGRDFGPMLAAERDARRGEDGTGAAGVTDDTEASARGVAAEGASRFAASALLPLLTLFGFLLVGIWFGPAGEKVLNDSVTAPLRLSGWQKLFANGPDTNFFLLIASGATLVVAVACARLLAGLEWAAIDRAVGTGWRVSLIPIAILTLAWTLGAACDELGTNKFLKEQISKELNPVWLPAIVFVLAGVTAFSTGTSWGTMAILIPSVASVALGLEGEFGVITLLSLAAVLDGAIFGDHCSPISDTTILSSTSARCDHLAHVRTQMPYSLIVAGLALACGYVPAAMGLPAWAGLAAGAAVIVGIFALPWAGRPE